MLSALCVRRVSRESGATKWSPQVPPVWGHLHLPPHGQHSVRTCRPSTTEVQCIPFRCVSPVQHIEDRKLLQKITSGEQILCSNATCGQSVATAVILCLDCEDYLCESCHISHQCMGKFTKGHTVKSLSELCSLPRSVLPSLVPHRVE